MWLALEPLAVRPEVVAPLLLAAWLEVVVPEPLAVQPKVVAPYQPATRPGHVLEPLALQPEVGAWSRWPCGRRWSRWSSRPCGRSWSGWSSWSCGRSWYKQQQ